MSSYNDRRWEMLLDDQVFIAATGGRQFKITFNILIDYGGYNSYCDISIYNLSQETASKVKAGDVLGFRAGYSDTIDYLFKGVIRNVFQEGPPPNRITRIIARGGSEAIDKSINQTLGKNSTIIDAISALTGAMGYPSVIQDGDFSNVSPFIGGYTMTGDPRRYLNDLAQANKFSWVLENNRIVITRNDSFRNGDVHVVSESTGMEGVPEISEVGCDVKVRLNPRIRIGGRIDVQSKLRTFNFSNLYFVDIPPSAGTGIYRVFKLSHSGDSWGDEWTTSIVSVR